MSVWDNYANRIATRGETKHDTVYRREFKTIHTKLPDNLSYQTVTVYEPEYGYNITESDMSSKAFTQKVAIINSDNLNEKYVYSLPGEDIGHGDLIEWMGNRWLVTEKDANTTMYTKAIMIQCNHLLKWVSVDDTVIEQWCIIEDGTKYLTGEYEDKYFIVTRGDSRIAMTIARNSETVKFNRENRFLIDDPDSPIKLAYLLLGWSFNQNGCYKFVLQEVNGTDYDDKERGIADYYKHFPKETGTDNEPTGGKKVWL